MLKSHLGIYLENGVVLENFLIIDCIYFKKDVILENFWVLCKFET